MDYKLIAIDLDDTLLGPDHQISAETKRVIQEAQDKGVKVVIATGRMHASAFPYAEQLGIEGPIITYNGAMIKKVASGEIVEHNPVSLDLTKKIAHYVQQHNLHLNLYMDDILYVNQEGSELKYYEDLAGVKAVLIKEELDEFIDAASTKLIIIDDEDKIPDILEDVKAKFDEQLHITTSKSVFIELMNPKVNKGQAVKYLANKYGFSSQEVITIGDSYNDREMLEYAGLGVAVDNAWEEVKKSADYITTGHDEEGVAEVIKKFLL
ncbi:MAG: Cof-type HAD-IIB family hydrolase [Halanaerobacter sp.]